jgi:aminopeptidase N
LLTTRVRRFLAATLIGGVAACGGPASRVPQGVSWQLAQDRHARISDLRYDLTFTIPAASDSTISGVATITLTLAPGRGPLVLDFGDAEHRAHGVTVDGHEVRFRTAHDHILIEGERVPAGARTIGVTFWAGDGSLNRNPDFLYTLFVPARAHSAFPCFDQPNLKARYTLTLDVPAEWVAVANGVTRSREVSGGRAVYHFAETRPIPTYLFAFAAGKFRVDSAVRDGRTFHMYHRETDGAKVARNRGTVYDLVAGSLAWLERYTAIPYPFDKYDFVLVPAFQYGGMEHPGAVFYNASGILLDSSATQGQLLGRASVIAHETSHMWFGDLVTMNWFDDVWTKEVYANFMAAKIVNPAFPHVNHDLRFLTAHYPAAYAVDRTEGANPIRQPLDNLDDAGTLYGAIIYEKAPIVMRQLETLIGDSVLRDGLRDYLKRFSYGNATWDSLIHILAERSHLDLVRWNHAWVDEPGRPTVEAHRAAAGERLLGIQLTQKDGAARGRVWPMRLDVLVQRGNDARVLPVALDSGLVAVPGAAGLPTPDFILPDGRGTAYGDFVLDPASLLGLLQHLPQIKDELVRGVGWLTLWDAVLDRRLAPARFLNAAIAGLEHETVDLDAQLVIGLVSATYWRFLTESERAAAAPWVEVALWAGVERAATPTLKAAFFSGYRGIALTPTGLDQLERIWRKAVTVPGLPLAENDYTALAVELALHGSPRATEILDGQLARITNPDRKARFQFVRPALSPDSATRAAFFATLSDRANRRHEPWVLDALNYLHHPLRARSAEPFILPSLELLPEIQRTGDIFFPERWAAATLSGHNTKSAAQVVRDFLATHPDFPPRLRAKVLQVADPLYRAAAIVGEKR